MEWLSCRKKIAFFSKSPPKRKTEKYINYGTIVLKPEWTRSKEMEEQLHKAIKGSIKLFFKQIRRRKPIKVSLQS